MFFHGLTDNYFSYGVHHSYLLFSFISYFYYSDFVDSDEVNVDWNIGLDFIVVSILDAVDHADVDAIACDVFVHKVTRVVHAEFYLTDFQF